jgi:hypothetical protein
MSYLARGLEQGAFRTGGVPNGSVVAPPVRKTIYGLSADENLFP